MVEEQALIDGLMAELASVLNATLGLSTTPVAATAEGGTDWVVPCTTDAATGTPVTLGFAADQAALLTARVLMSTDTPPDVDIADTLKELISQAVGALNLKPMMAGAPLMVQAAERRTSGPAPAHGCWFTLPIDATFTLRTVGWAERRAASARPKNGSGTGIGTVPENLDVILDIDLPLSVRFGHAEMTLDALTKLGPGSLIELARSPDDPVELLVNGKLVARGEVVVVSGNYGVRVSEVVSAAERIRTLE
jgi:flagellar motor switch protein FliN/FliY